MKWLKHIVDSGDDPDIDDAITLFGSDGYYVFFRTLEVMGREFDINSPGINVFSVEFLRKKYRISWGKVVKILSFYQEKRRIFYELLNDNRLPSIMLNCPKLQELSDEYTQKGLKKISGQTPDLCRDKVTIEEEVEEDKEEKKKEKKPPVSDNEWIKTLEDNPIYSGLEVRVLYGKMIVWCENNGKKPTRRRFVNWLNREDKPLQAQQSGNGRLKPKPLPTHEEELAAFNEQWDKEHPREEVTFQS